MDRKLKKRLADAAELTATEARVIASAFSKRIPEAISVRSDRDYVSVVSNGKLAPSGRPNEMGSRHPVFGNREVWRKIPLRPYMEVAEARTIDRVTELAANVIDDWMVDWK